MAMIHPVQLALREEVLKTPDLLEQLKAAECQDFPEELAVIGNYCGVIIHGDYFQEDLLNLCDILIRKLREKNKLIIYS